MNSRYRKTLVVDLIEKNSKSATCNLSPSFLPSLASRMKNVGKETIIKNNSNAVAEISDFFAANIWEHGLRGDYEVQSISLPPSAADNRNFSTTVLPLKGTEQ